VKTAVLALALVAGCDACGKQTAPPPPVPSAEGPGERAPRPKTALAGKDPWRSLIAWTDSRVAVSSTVDNPRDLPEHLIDRKASTAWNGRTGDLVGAWMAFRVPQEARVRQIRITCGFDAHGPDVAGKRGSDLFTLNQRIKKLRITRDGEPLRDVELDVDKRDAQTIDVDAAGGDFVLTVIEVVPGTKKEWRELVVSELDVVGAPGKALRPTAHTPRVRVGSLDAPDPGASDAAPESLPRGPYPSLDAFCKKWLEVYTPVMKEVAADERFPCQGLHAECTHRPAAAVVAPTFRSAALVTTSEKSTKLALALEIQQGWYVDSLVLDDSERCVLGDPEQREAALVSLEPPKDGVVHATIDTKSFAPMYQRELDDGGTEQAMWLAVWADRTLYACRMEGAGEGAAPACRKDHVLLEFHGEGTVPDVSKWSKP
jgi:hypothetical protein